ncbi:AraC family transcriptional regulator ligand-binding domain-containing protein [Porticoccus sp. GXU_MW_L64]
MFASVPDSVGLQATLLSNWVQVAYRAMRLYHLDAEQIFADAGIDIAQLYIPGDRILSHKVRNAWRMGAEAYGSQAFGIKAAEAAYPGMYHSLSVMLTSCHNLREMLNKLMRYRRVVDTISVNNYEENSEYAKFTWTPIVDYESQVGAEAWISCFICLYRWAAGENLSPARVTLQRSNVDTPDIYRDFFASPVDFGVEENALYFSVDTLDTPLLSANSSLMAKNEQVTTEYLARLLRGDLVNSVYSQILSAMGIHEVSLDKVAEKLNMSTRTLQRKLKGCNTSFESLVEEVFRERALQYMENPDFSIQEVGRVMGFNDLSNFSRAFKRWTSMSPTEYRKLSPGDR